MKVGTRRKRILLITACSVASGMVFSTRVWAQSAPAPIIIPATPATGNGPIIPGGQVTPQAQAVHIEKIKKFYRELLLKEKNVAAAVSHIDRKQIEATGTQTGSIQSLLKQTPSVNEYQQNIGQGVPVLTVRGVRNSQLAETLNGNIPLQDLANGGQGSFLTNNIGSPITLGQIESTTVYPGVAPPDKQGFATIGGTIAYVSKKPTSKPYAKIFGGFGSFDSSNAGFEINTGNIGTGIDAPRALLRYNQSYTSGFPDGNSIRSGDMLFDIEKPYDEGLSHVSATVIFNRADGYIATAPLPVPLIDSKSYSFNFPHSLSFSKQNNKYLTAIISDQTFINPHLILSGKLFYLRQPSSFSSYVDQRAIYNPADPGVYPSTYPYGGSYPYQVNFQVPFFPNGPYFGPQIPLIQANSGVALGLPPSFPYPNAYLPPYETYNPQGQGLTLIPNQPNGAGTATGVIEQGLNAEQTYGGTQTIGFAPRANIFLPDNDITIGGILAKEMNLPGSTYYGSYLPIPQDSGNLVSLSGGGTQRTIFQMFAQDRINILDNKLHIEPGFQLTGVYSSSIAAFSTSQSTITPYNAANGFGISPNGGYKLKNFSSQIDPYIGVSYDLPDHFVAYAAYGKGARFAPTTDYTLGTVGTAGGAVSTTSAPKPEVVHAYDLGLRYDTPRLYLNVDTYYQKLTSGFSFYTNYATGQQNYQNIGVQQFRGYEMSGKYRLTHDIELFGNTSYNQANYLNSYFAQDTPFEGQYGFVFKGDPLAGVPNWLGNFGVEYDHGPFTARLSGQYTGQQYITFDLSPALSGINSPIISPIAAAADPANPNLPLGLATTPYYPTPEGNLAQKISGLGPIPNFKLPAYLLMNVYLSYNLKLHGYDHLKSLKFSLNIQNLLGLHYYQHYFLAPSESISITSPFNGFINNPTYASAFTGPPRSIYLNVTATF